MHYILNQRLQINGTSAIHGTQHNILGTPPIKTVYILVENNRVHYEVLHISRTNASNRPWCDSSVIEFSAKFSQRIIETLKVIMYSDVISFDELNLSQLVWLEIEEFEVQLIDLQSNSIWIQKFIEARKKLELIETERLTRNISKNASNEIMETWNSIPDTFNCLKKLVHAILTIFSPAYARKSLFSQR
ncbi:general transcription factor II-I repeat domain-containing protein 2A [Trichonephila clavipes]|nr:general transcription factor II-I repeat domain-containing protein 2A [Trichonephila clavipes]